MDKNKLRELIKYHDDLYYNKGETELTDKEYDTLKASLGDDVDWVGVDVVNNTIEHMRPMLSLRNVFSEEELSKWITNVIDKVEGEPSFIYEHKYDGMALVLRYDNGKLVSAATRGNGSVGNIVSETIWKADGIQNTFEGFTGEVRGELVMMKDKFPLVNQLRKDKGHKQFSNMRNAVAGIVNSKTPVPEHVEALKFYTYGMVGNHEYTTYVKTINHLAKHGFNISSMIICDDLLPNVVEVFSDTNAYNYDVDGFVVKVNDLAMQEELGNATTHPKYAVAYKFEAIGVLTSVNNYTWQVGRTGRLTPVAHVDPVDINGATVSMVTLHNPNEIKRLGIMVNDKVSVIRAGEVIPKIDEVFISLREDDVVPIEIPTVCPACDGVTSVRDTGGNLYCTNVDCNGRVIQQLSHFCSKEAMDIDGLSTNTIEVMYNAGLLNQLGDLYRLHESKEQLLAMQGFSDRKVKKLLNSIKSSAIVPLYKFIYALGIESVGRRASKKIAQYVESVEAFLNCDIESVCEALNLSKPIQQNLKEFFTTNELYEQTVNLVENWLTVTMDETIDEIPSLTIVITGTFDLPRKVIVSKLAEKNIKTTDTVTSTADGILIGNKPSKTKVDKARNIGLPILSVADYL